MPSGSHCYRPKMRIAVESVSRRRGCMAISLKTWLPNWISRTSGRAAWSPSLVSKSCTTKSQSLPSPSTHSASPSRSCASAASCIRATRPAATSNGCVLNLLPARSQRRSFGNRVRLRQNSLDCEPGITKRDRKGSGKPSNSARGFSAPKSSGSINRQSGESKYHAVPGYSDSSSRTLSGPGDDRPRSYLNHCPDPGVPQSASSARGFKPEVSMTAVAQARARWCSTADRGGRPLAEDACVLSKRARTLARC